MSGGGSPNRATAQGITNTGQQPGIVQAGAGNVGAPASGANTRNMGQVGGLMNLFGGYGQQPYGWAPAAQGQTPQYPPLYGGYWNQQSQLLAGPGYKSTTPVIGQPANGWGSSPTGGVGGGSGGLPYTYFLNKS